MATEVTREEQRLREMLRSLPMPGASLGFRARVMARIESSGGPPGAISFSLRMVAAAAAVLLLGLALAVSLRSTGEDHAELDAAPIAQRVSPSEQELRELREKYRALERELNDLRRVAREMEPVVGIEGPSADYLIDLRDLAAAAPRGAATPAGFRNR